jgi:NAD(P)-dependent dehydrogenase (short-subunit alcohol dehydrogenase family)
MTKNPFDLSGTVAVITGSSRGIGRAIAETMAALGAKVVISSRKADACEEVAEAIRRAKGEAIVIPCNISRKDHQAQPQAMGAHRHSRVQRRRQSLLRTAGQQHG